MKKFLLLPVLFLSLTISAQKNTIDLYHYSAIVNHIRDGDTFEALVSLGFDVYTNLTIRMANIDAPEMKGADSVSAMKSKNYLSRILFNKKIYFNSKQYDRYKRSIAEVYLSTTDTISVNTIMVQKGYARKVKY